MKTENEIKLCLIGQTGLAPEWTSLLGDKYREALPFPWALTESVSEAQIIAWDGVVTAKSRSALAPVVSRLHSGKAVLLLQREAYTLFNDDPFLEFLDVKGLKTVELQSGNVLPEDLLESLLACHEALTHV